MDDIDKDYDLNDLLDMMGSGISPMTDALVDLMDEEPVSGDGMVEVYIKWAVPAALLSRQLVEEVGQGGELCPGLVELVEYAPTVDECLRSYISNPSKDNLQLLVLNWMGARDGGEQILESLHA